ncbi:MAG: hypothetical protein EU539_03795 [Promethearchaeota archaeon]|nr:MAG: hypothetical protein EU539_03795 [Candidatus Lokiarchaeota archaeon]
MESKKKSDETRSLTYTIQNIVVKANLFITDDLKQEKLTLNIEEISKKWDNTEFKNRFPGLFIRFTDPKCVIILFSSGNLILTGLKLFNHIELVLLKLITEINISLNSHFKMSEVEPEVVNIVVSASYDDKIDLNLTALLIENVIYEPEIFPALIYKSIKPVKCVFLVFNNGKVILTGIKDKDDIEPTLIKFGKLLKKKALFVNQLNI